MIFLRFYNSKKITKKTFKIGLSSQYCYICKLFEKMKRIFIYISLIFCTLNTFAQIHEIGVFAGGINYIGDVGPTDYIAPNDPAFGKVADWVEVEIKKLAKKPVKKAPKKKA